MKVEFIDKMGDDLRVANAARVSFDKESKWAEERCNCGYAGHPDYCDGSCTHPRLVLSEADERLINYLATHGHWTPFSHVMVTMRETMPIFLARQRFKHMIGFTYNEVSRRYVDDEPTFYVPKQWRKRAENKKQGSSDEVFVSDAGFSLGDANGDFDTVISWYLEDSLSLYTQMISAGVCPEQARMVLPQSMYTSYYVTGSLAAWARAYKQRTDDHSQREWGEITPQWDAILREHFPVSWKALTQ